MELLRFEKNLYKKDKKLIAGVDEVGRGPLAGPMVVAAAVLDIERILDLEFEFTENTENRNIRNNDVEYTENQALIKLRKEQTNDVWNKYSKINDSKKVSEKNRNLLDIFIRENAISYSIIEISNEEIDSIGISQATQKCFYEAITQLKVRPDHIMTDSFEIRNFTKDCQTNLIKGDSNSISIAAASIIAKVYRDNLMIKFHEKYPEYGFDQHKGYGTKAHLDMLKKHGPCQIHRRSFSPIKEMLETYN
jgi:ribonuclease HII